MRCTAQTHNPLGPSARANSRDGSLPRQGKSSCVGVYLPTQVERAGSVGKATRAAGYKSGFVVVEHPGCSRWGQLPDERAGNTVAISACKFIGPDVAQVTDIQDELCGSSEASQLGSISPVDDVNKKVALVQRRSRDNVPRDNAIERHLLARCYRSGCHGKHCRKAGEEQWDCEA